MITAAAALYWRHFGHQILPVPTAHRQGVALVRKAIRPDHAVVALSAHGRLIGIMGLRDADGGLLNPDADSFLAVWGRAEGRLRHLATRLYRAGAATDDLVIDGIAIRPEWRRRGIARLLIRYASARARNQGRAGLRVEVAADNPGGLSAWRAMGFAALPPQRLGWPWKPPSHVLRIKL